MDRWPVLLQCSNRHLFFYCPSEYVHQRHVTGEWRNKSRTVRVNTVVLRRKTKRRTKQILQHDVVFFDIESGVVRINRKWKHRCAMRPTFIRICVLMKDAWGRMGIHAHSPFFEKLGMSRPVVVNFRITSWNPPKALTLTIRSSPWTNNGQATTKRRIVLVYFNVPPYSLTPKKSL